MTAIISIQQWFHYPYQYTLQFLIHKGEVSLMMVEEDTTSDELYPVMRSGVVRLSNNRAYAQWLLEFKDDILSCYRKSEWFVSQAHTDQGKYLAEFERCVKQLAEQFNLGQVPL